MPSQQRVGLEQEDDRPETGASTGRQCRQFTSEDEQREFLPPGNAGRCCTLEDTQLLAAEDFDVLGMVGLAAHQDEVNQQQEGMGQEIERQFAGGAGNMPRGKGGGEIAQGRLGCSFRTIRPFARS